MDYYVGSVDMDDDWFYESVMRYKTLQMFYLQNIPEHVLQMDNWTLCIASRYHKNKNMELLEVKLPAKLTMPAEDEGRSKENDFKMLARIYIDQSIHQMGILREEKKIIASHENDKGFHVYSFHSDDEIGVKQKSHLFANKDWIAPNFTVHQKEKKIILSMCSHNPLVICDINSKKVIKELKSPFNESVLNCLECSLNNVTCELLDNNMLTVLNVKTGVIALIDLRMENIVSVLGRDEINDELWTVSQYDFETSSNYFGALSTKGNLSLYDQRNNSNNFISECFCSVSDNYNILKLKIANGERFSISGVDSNIYVYDILKKKCKLAFTHNGHNQKIVSNDVETLISDHIWLPSIGNNFVLSVCNNGSLNCWEYEYNEFIP